MGAAHGSAHADEIVQFAKDRVDLVADGLWSGGPLKRGDVLDLAQSMLPHHEAFDAALHAEMSAMAEAAGISAAEAVVLGGFTDFVDTVRAQLGGVHPPTVIEDDCTAVIIPNDRANGHGFLAQTWDMHDSATDHVVLLRLQPADRPQVTIFTTTGCLGQIGMNEAGVCVGINNLTCTDGAIGVTWPSVVRAMLGEESAGAALAVLQAAELAGAHNFLIFDRQGVGYNVEAMPSTRPVTPLTSTSPIVHTNHVIDERAAVHQAERPGPLMDSSRRRRQAAEELLFDRVVDEADLFSLLREPGAICQRPVAPFHIESSGAAVMRPGTADFWACWGVPIDNEFEHVGAPTPAQGGKRQGG
jgi:isopenicillin-N N-acyltransferase-like protein